MPKHHNAWYAMRSYSMFRRLSGAEGRTGNGYSATLRPNAAVSPWISQRSKQQQHAQKAKLAALVSRCTGT
jgi:hypothetical protein